MSDVRAEEVTPVQYARTCGITIGYVYSQIWGGRLPARKDGKKWRIPASAIRHRTEQRAAGGESVAV